MLRLPLTGRQLCQLVLTLLEERRGLFAILHNRMVPESAQQAGRLLADCVANAAWLLQFIALQELGQGLSIADLHLGRVGAPPAAAEGRSARGRVERLVLGEIGGQTGR